MTDLTAKTAEVFRRTNAYAKAHGYAGALPVFQEAWFNGEKVLGAYLIDRNQADYRLVSGDSLKDVSSETDLFQAVCEAAVGLGYAFGFPTFESVSTESDVFCQAVFIRHLPGESRVCEAHELGAAANLGQAVRRVHEYARCSGFKTGLPRKFDRTDGIMRIDTTLIAGGPLKWIVLSAAELNI